MAIYHLSTRMIGRSNGGSPVRALAYMGGVSLSDERTGEVFCFEDKSVQDVPLLLPQNAPAWAREIQELIRSNRTDALQQLSDRVNRAEKRLDAQVYREVEFALPRELTFEQNKKLAEEYVQDQFCMLGMLAVQSFHLETCAKTGEPNPHCHTFFLTRDLTEKDLSPFKNRAWNSRELHETWREQWAQYATFHLRLHGYDITLDNRSYARQGLDIEPQIKMGKSATAQERQNRTPHHPTDQPFGYDFEKGEFGRAKTAQSRIQELRAIQLRNLYRILRRPEIVFEIVTRHHATFMWGDVQKVLARYIDDATLFQRLDGRLKHSAELILLKPGDEKAVYTTRNMLKTEKSLVQTAETLANVKSHQIAGETITSGMTRMQEKLKDSGYSLSEGQERAIRHLTEEGQLKCIVGYAGAGKTTALEACRDIWEEAGYRVYGLAPTGRAAQNLEGSGIKSQTLHKFLKSFEEGRSQYKEKSILVLDEAGMVDVQRFEQFLGAVKTLGVKAVVVGDAGQLQPVEAGPAFRLITERIPTSKLEEVVRQEKEWQREATVLFGRQETEQAIQAYLKENRFRLVREKRPEKIQKDQIPDPRQATKGTLLWDWHVELREAHQKTVLMMAYRNRDVQDLNAGARELLKISGHIGKEETIYHITRDVEDDFGRRTKVKEDRAFSAGDRILFTRNKNDLGVRNGSCGTVVALEKRSIEVKLDTGKMLTFSPDIFPYFDQGWAVTIHKAQGMTVDKSFVLASYETSRNLTYVALTRHREDVQIYGSTEDFWSADKVPEVLSKSGEKLGAGDYLSAESLEALMKDEDKFLGKLLTRLSDELQAMGAVSKKAFEAVVDHFLGRTPERDASLNMYINPEIQREETQAEEILRAPKETERVQEHTLSLGEKLREFSVDDNRRTGTSRDLSKIFERFQEVRRELDRDPGSFVFRHEWRELGKTLFDHKEAYAQIERQDRDTAREIHKAAEQERQRSRDQGLSL